MRRVRVFLSDKKPTRLWFRCLKKLDHVVATDDWFDPKVRRRLGLDVKRDSAI
jgi:hypothetical protein